MSRALTATAVLWVSAVLALPGCSLFASKPASIEGTLRATETLNLSVTKRPSPLRLVVYELKAPTAFSKADFMSLYQTDQATLGAEFVAREELILQPGEKRTYVRTLQPETRYLGIFAAYRDLEHATWRTVEPVRAGKTMKLQVLADTLAVSVTVQP